MLVADPEPVTRGGLIQLINEQPQLRVCAETETLLRARELCAEHKPRVVMMDLAMGDSFAFIAELTRTKPETRVVIFTAQCDWISVQRAFKAGACAFVARRDPVSALIAALIGALSGERHVGPGIERLLLDNLARGTVEMEENEAAGLSDRELQVFQLMGLGHNTRTLAAKLGVSTKTIETHRRRMKMKLGVSTGTELQRRAVLFRAKSSE